MRTDTMFCFHIQEVLQMIPIWEKVTLTIEEAAQYSNIGENKLYKLTNDPLCPYVLWSGRKRLIKRKEFEKYLLASKAI